MYSVIFLGEPCNVEVPSSSQLIEYRMVTRTTKTLKQLVPGVSAGFNSLLPTFQAVIARRTALRTLAALRGDRGAVRAVDVVLWGLDGRVHGLCAWTPGSHILTKALHHDTRLGGGGVRI